MFMMLFLLLNLSFSLSAQNLACGDLKTQSFEDLATDFVTHFQESQEEDLCQIHRLLAIRKKIVVDMLSNTEKYEAELEFLNTLERKFDSARYIKHVVQEAYFDVCLQTLLRSESSRATSWGRGATIGLASLAGTLFLIPMTKRVPSRLSRIIQNLGRSFIDKRPIVFGTSSTATSGVTVAHESTPTRRRLSDEEPVCAWKSPFGSDAGLDERTNHIFVNELGIQIGAIGFGIAAGWPLGHYASLGVKKRYPDWSGIFKGAKWANSKIVKWGSPGVLFGMVVTSITANTVTSTTTDLVQKIRLNAEEGEISQLFLDLNKAIRGRDELKIWLLGEKIRNHWLLARARLTRDFWSQLTDYMWDSRQRMEMRLCFEKETEIIVTEQPTFDRNVSKTIANHRDALTSALNLGRSVARRLRALHQPLLELTLARIERAIVEDEGHFDAQALAADKFESVTFELARPEFYCEEFNTLGWPF